MRLEAAHERVAQHSVPRPSVAQPAPRTIARETPVRRDGQRSSEHTRVERERGPEVRCEAVLRYPRYRIVRAAAARNRLLKPRTHHIPPERALRAEEHGHAEERCAQCAREPPAGGEVGQREDECEADGAAQDAVAPLHVVDRLEVVERHARVQSAF